MLVYAIYPKERKDVGTYLCNPLPSKASHTSGKKYSVQDSFPRKKYLFRLPTGSTSLRIGYLTISPQNLKMIPHDHCMVGLSDI